MSRIDMINKMMETAEGIEVLVFSFWPKNYNGSFYLENIKIQSPHQNVFDKAQELKKEGYEIIIDTDNFKIEIENDDMDTILSTYDAREASIFLNNL